MDIRIVGRKGGGNILLGIMIVADRNSVMTRLKLIRIQRMRMAITITLMSMSGRAAWRLIINVAG